MSTFQSLPAASNSLSNGDYSSNRPSDGNSDINSNVKEVIPVTQIILPQASPSQASPS